MALQYELLKNIASGDLDLLNFASTFTYSGGYEDDIRAFFERIVVPFHNDVVRVLKPNLEAEEDASREKQDALPHRFIDRSRLEQLRAVSSSRFDLSKVIRLCEELDFSFRNECYHSVAALTRALIDHVPPIFGMRTFSEVANSYAGTRSFKESMTHLESSARKIGDAHLHAQVRQKEVLPTATQVNFSNDLDVLLAEIVRLLR